MFGALTTADISADRTHPTARGYAKMAIRWFEALTGNARPSGQLDYPSYGWDAWAIVGTRVQLKAGPNTLRLTHQLCAPELDAVELAPLS